jgi:hypothetical protein
VRRKLAQPPNAHQGSLSLTRFPRARHHRTALCLHAAHRGSLVLKSPRLLRLRRNLPARRLCRASMSSLQMHEPLRNRWLKQNAQLKIYHPHCPVKRVLVRTQALNLHQKLESSSPPHPKFDRHVKNPRLRCDPQRMSQCGGVLGRNLHLRRVLTKRLHS